MVPAGGAGDLAATREAVERQTRPPDELLTATDLASGARAAAGRPTTWTWLVDGDVEPEPTALDELLEAAGRTREIPQPVLLASRLVRPDGTLDPSSLPVVDSRDLDFAVAAFERRLLALRVARRGSLLVRLRGAESRLPGAGRGSDLVWTAGLLRREPGLLAPASVAVRRAARERAPLELGARLRLLGSDSIALFEKPWFAFRLLEDALQGLRGRPPGG